mgnify:CR=1 FL=1
MCRLKPAHSSDGYEGTESEALKKRWKKKSMCSRVPLSLGQKRRGREPNVRTESLLHYHFRIGKTVDTQQMRKNIFQLYVDIEIWGHKIP